MEAFHFVPEENTVGYDTANVIGSKTLFIIASVCSSIH